MVFFFADLRGPWMITSYPGGPGCRGIDGGPIKIKTFLEMEDGLEENYQVIYIK